jgi:hypothetical protein
MVARDSYIVVAGVRMLPLGCRLRLTNCDTVRDGLDEVRKGWMSEFLDECSTESHFEGSTCGGLLRLWTMACITMKLKQNEKGLCTWQGKEDRCIYWHIHLDVVCFLDPIIRGRVEAFPRREILPF